MILIIAAMLATAGPHDEICLVASQVTAAAIIAREAGVPLDKALKAIDETTDPIARRLMRDAVLEMYSKGRSGAPFDEAEFINLSTASCIVHLETEVKDRP